MPLVSGFPRVLRTSALVALAVVVSVGCGVPGGSAPAAPTARGGSAPGVGGSAGAPSATASRASASTDASGESVWLPEWAGDDLPNAVAGRRPLAFCGVEKAPAPQPMEFIDQAVRLCFWEAAQSGREAEFVSIQTTMEGAPFAQIYRLASDGTVEVLTDFSQDPLGSGGWQRMVCEEVVEGEGESLLGVARCGESTTIE